MVIKIPVTADISTFIFRYIGRSPQTNLFAVLALVGSLAIVHLSCMFHNILLAQNSCATHLAVVFANCQAEVGIMKHGAVHAIVQWV
jgi:hypothetical protein